MPRTPGSAGNSRCGCNVNGVRGHDWHRWMLAPPRSGQSVAVCCPASLAECRSGTVQGCRHDSTLSTPLSSPHTASYRRRRSGADRPGRSAPSWRTCLAARRPRRPQRVRHRARRHPQLPAAAAAVRGAPGAARPGIAAHRAGRAGHPRGDERTAPGRAPRLLRGCPGRHLSRDDGPATTSGGNRKPSSPSARSAPTGSPNCPTADSQRRWRWC